MIFNELYSAYYNAVAEIISAILDGEKSEKDLNKIVSEKAFGESFLTILPALKSGKWQLVNEDLTTPIKNKPTMPLTLIQKRWLKSISSDPRIRLFDADFSALDETQPLFTEQDYYVYDKYCDGDDFSDEGYIQRFKMILSAIKNKKPLKITSLNRNGAQILKTVLPKRLEYSEKDDKFRLISVGSRYGRIINLARIVKCEECENIEFTPRENASKNIKTVTLRVSEERNTLERCMLHFAHFEKSAEKIEDHYLLHINYDRDDESEIVIRVLSFGPLVEVLEPQDFRKLIINKLKSQKSCELF